MSLLTTGFMLLFSSSPPSLSVHASWPLEFVSIDGCDCYLKANLSRNQSIREYIHSRRVIYLFHSSERKAKIEREREREKGVFWVFHGRDRVIEFLLSFFLIFKGRHFSRSLWDSLPSFQQTVRSKERLTDLKTQLSSARPTDDIKQPSMTTHSLNWSVWDETISVSSQMRAKVSERDLHFFLD